MKKFFKFILLLVIIAILFAGARYFISNRQTLTNFTNQTPILNTAAIKEYAQPQTKITNNRNLPIYHHLAENGPWGQFSASKYFKNNFVQANASAQTKQGKFWHIYVDGRAVGWISDRFFQHNKIALAHKISLVRNPNYSFPAKDAISYVVNQNGTAINPDQVTIKPKQINTANPGIYQIHYRYGKIKQTIKATVRTNINEGTTIADQLPVKGPAPIQSWSGPSQKSSPNWKMENFYQPETKISRYSGTDKAQLITRFFQPRFHLLANVSEDDSFNQIGVLPEGINFSKNWLTVTSFTDGQDEHGHLVSYNLKRLKSPLQTQNLTSLPWQNFIRQTSNIRVSPYLKLGHGQSLGTTKKYIYVLASSNKAANSAASMEILQLKRPSMAINHLWTFKLWNRSSYFPRYLHNAYFANNHTIYAVFHNDFKGCYEYWRIIRNGDNWNSTEIAATASNFVTNQAPVQGFTYQQGHFYLSFNDNIFVLAKNGRVLQHYHFKTGRENEGVAVNKGQIYVELAKRAELLKLQK